MEERKRKAEKEQADNDELNYALESRILALLQQSCAKPSQY